MGARRVFSDQMIGEIGDPLACQLLHNLLELTLEHGDRVIATFTAESADTIHEGASKKGEAGSAGQRACDIRASSQAAVDHDSEFISVGFG